MRRFERKQSLVAFAGVDAPPCQSGTFESKNRHISKRGSPRLRKTLFQVMSTIIQHAPADDPVFQFLDRKRKEGKHYYVYMTAAANKFLRIYYGTVICSRPSLLLSADRVPRQTERSAYLGTPFSLSKKSSKCCAFSRVYGTIESGDARCWNAGKWIEIW